MISKGSEQKYSVSVWESNENDKRLLIRFYRCSALESIAVQIQYK